MNKGKEQLPEPKEKAITEGVSPNGTVAFSNEHSHQWLRVILPGHHDNKRIDLNFLLPANTVPSLPLAKPNPEARGQWSLLIPSLKVNSLEQVQRGSRRANGKYVYRESLVYPML